MKNYCKIIKKLRTEHNLTQTDMAKLLNTTQQVYSRYEKGENELPVRHLVTICNFFNVSSDYVLSIEEFSKE